ncbi:MULTISPECIES: hypothetical protein [unclassified Streptomyces]|uniref:hypothetical protein n=1 Tax=unclassified Streptomyces TaxID=2593676 RepID=UPI002034EF62|nr:MULTISPECIES: hypothetical protein [unclassified Streptomyces]
MRGLREWWFPPGDDAGRSQSRLPHLDVEDVRAKGVAVRRRDDERELPSLAIGFRAAPRQLHLDRGRRTSSDDPELFAAYRVLAADLGGAVTAHLDVLTTQLTRIIGPGADAGVFITTEPTTTARAVFHAPGRFHDPRYFRDSGQHDIEAHFDAVVELVLRGLRARTGRPPGA